MNCANIAWKRLLSLCAAGLGLMGCRLYEPPRYARLKFNPGDPSTRVLMVGDSLTYYNDLPGLLQQFSVHQKAPIDIDQVTSPYTSLKVHWEMGAAAERIRNRRWDYVILQEFSRKPVTDPDETLASIAKFNDLAKKSGANVILFENWTRAGREFEFPDLVSTYKKAQVQTGAPLAPIGAAWRACAAARPDIRLYLDDRHPTDAGTYLAAAVLYDTIYHKKSSDLGMDLQGPKLPEGEMKALRDIADRAAAEQ